MAANAPDEGTLGIAAHSGVAIRVIEYCAERTAVNPVEDREILLSSVDTPTLITPVASVVDSSDERVVGSLADIMSATVYRSRSRLADKLRPAVSVEVVDEELYVVSTGTDIRSEVQGPQSPRFVIRFRHIELIAVDDHGTRHSAEGIVLGVCRFPFDDQLVLSVAVDISHRASR